MKEIFVNRNEQYIEIAITEDKKLIRYYKNENDSRPKVGDIYKGTVKKLVPALKGAFVDIGYDKNAFLYIDRKLNNTNIKQQDEVIVQVLKEEVGSKGAKVTNNISLPGKYSVLLGAEHGIFFSRKIENNIFKENMKAVLADFNEFGIMLRTESEKSSRDEITKEIFELKCTYEEIIKKSRFHSAPFIISKTKGILYRILIDIVDNNTSRIILNSNEDYEMVDEFVKEKLGEQVKVQIYSEELPLFDAFGLKKSLVELENRKVFLPCGGYLVIEKTEAMHVIDVNSGKNVREKSISRTALETNLEAAKEIGRQVILRNLGGIIIIDFIDMTEDSDKFKVIDALNESFAYDKNKTIIYPFTELNLVQIARRRGEI